MKALEKKLPPHLEKVINAYEEKCKAFGLNPNWAIEALEKAEAANDDNALIHGLIA